MNAKVRRESSIDSAILQLRGLRVMLGVSLARLYGVPTGVLMQAVKRNRQRFPSDFMFQLAKQQVTDLKSQIVISSFNSSEAWGGRRTLPYAFSEQGVAMLSSVLRSPRAIAVNIAIMRAFVRLRELAGVNVELAKKLDELERKVAAQGEDIAGIVRVIRQLAAPPDPAPKRSIGFVA
jgi:hypothetical protein